MRLLKPLLMIASRGGLRVGYILLTISLFTGLVSAVEATAHSYAREASVLREISLTPRVMVDPMPGKDALRVEAAALNLMDYTVMVFAVEDPIQFLSLQGARLVGAKPGMGEALVGLRLKPHVRNGTLTIQGQTLRVSGYISPTSSPSHLSYAVIVAPGMVGVLGLEFSTLYYSRAVEGSGLRLAEAPSSMALVGGVTREALTSLDSVAHLLVSMLILTCIVQGYNTAHESRRVLRVFSTLGASRRMMALSLTLLALTLSLVGVSVGFSLGVLASALISSLLSLWLGLPYIKPVAGPTLLNWMGYILASSLAALSIGFLRGYGFDGD